MILRRVCAVVRAELTGSNICTALGITVRSTTPVLAVCRVLVERGHDPNQRLDCYRNGTLALTVRSIGEAAALEIDGRGTGFKCTRPVGTAPPAAQTVPGYAPAANPCFQGRHQ
jgi:hypothetical protein